MQLSECYQEALSQGKNVTVRLLYFDENTLSSPKILLLKRSDSTRLAGQLEPPGGKLEVGELPEKGILREMYEETGINLAKRSVDFAFYFDFTLQEGDSIREFFFIAIGPSEPLIIDPKEHCSFAWIRLDRLSDYPLHPAIRSFLNAKILWIQQFLDKL